MKYKIGERNIHTLEVILEVISDDKKCGEDVPNCIWLAKGGSINIVGYKGWWVVRDEYWKKLKNQDKPLFE